MDILKEYKEQFPGIKNNSVEDDPAREYGFFIRLVMRLSGGKIQDARWANYALLAVSGIAILIAFAIFFFNGGNNIPLPPPTPFQEEKNKIL